MNPKTASEIVSDHLRAIEAYDNRYGSVSLGLDPATLDAADYQAFVGKWGSYNPGDPMPTPGQAMKVRLIDRGEPYGSPDLWRVYKGEGLGEYVEVEARDANEAMEKAVQKGIIDEIIDPDVGLVISDRARDPLYVREVLLTLYDGRQRVVDDDDFAMALWKLRAHGCVDWCGLGSATPGRPSRELTEVGRRLAERELASNPLL